MFSDAAGYEKETDHDAVMERLDIVTVKARVGYRTTGRAGRNNIRN